MNDVPSKSSPTKKPVPRKEEPDFESRPEKNGENSSMSEGGKSFSIHCSKTRLKKKEAKATGGKGPSQIPLLCCCFAAGKVWYTFK